jgi:putative endonuclease
MSDIVSILSPAEKHAPHRTSEFGVHGEQMAADHLVKNGYRLVVSNFKVPVGRNSKGIQVTGEIDIVALDGETLCFIEVKTRRSEEFTPVITNVDRRKQRQIVRVAKIYRRIFAVHEMEHRYDVVTVLMPKHAEPSVNLVKGFFSEAKFRKRQWGGRTRDDFV